MGIGEKNEIKLREENHTWDQMTLGVNNVILLLPNMVGSKMA